MPRVSVIIPAYNAGAYLAAALESVLRQTYTDYEVVVVNDGSTDDTGDIAASYTAGFQGKLRCVYQENRGLPAARNTAIRHSTGEFIALLDADDVWLNHRLERGVAAMDGATAVGLVHARVGRIDAAGRRLKDPPSPPARYLSGSIGHHIYTRRAHLLCPTIMFRRQCLKVAGMFDESMRATEDRDLWFRIARHYPVAYVNEILAYYRISASSMSSDPERMWKWQTFFIEKYHRLGACNAIDVREAMANLCRERGDTLFREGHLRQSLGCYLRSVSYNPLNVSNVYMLVRAIGEPVLAKFRAGALPTGAES